MRILEVIRSMERGGAQQLLVNRLRSQPALLHYTTVINTLPERAVVHLDFPDNNGQLLAASGKGPLGAHRFVRRMIRDLQPDAVIVHSPTPAILLKTDRIFGRMQQPLIEVVHNSRYAKRLVELASVVTNRGASSHIAVSSGAANSHLMLNSKHRFILHAGVPAEGLRRWAAKNSDWITNVRGSYLKDRDGVLLVSVGRLTAQKRHSDLIQAFAAARCPAAHLLIVGDGALRDSLEAQVAHLGLVDRVSFAGDQPEGWRYLAAGDIVCLPSEFEGLSVVLMEAQALGKPSIASDIPGISDILIDHENALLFPTRMIEELTRAIETLAFDRGLRERLSTGATAASASWDSETAAETFYGYVKRIVDIDSCAE